MGVNWRARYLIGDNQDILWAKFGTLGEAVLLCNKENALHAHGHF
jgi:hypothetical protein